MINKIKEDKNLRLSFYVLVGVMASIIIFVTAMFLTRQATRINSQQNFQIASKNVHLYGKPLQVNDRIKTNYKLDLPVLTIDTMKQVNLDSYENKWRVIETVPSIDTPVCAMQTAQINLFAPQYKNTTFIMISQDTPFAQKRYMGSKSLSNVKVLSDYRNSFSKDNHLLIKETKLNSRTILVIDSTNKVRYIQYVKDETKPLNLNKVLDFLDANGGK